MFDLEKLKDPDIKYWPDVRWWLAEGLHTDETLKYEVELLKESGFGAIEFLAMEDPGADSSIYGWGSEEWVHDSQTLVEETTKRGMGVSLTCGTNWSNANLTTICPDDPAAAQEIDFAEETVKAGCTKEGPLPIPALFMPGVTKQTLLAVTATRIVEGEKGNAILDPACSYVLTDEVRDGALSWTAPEDGDYLLCTFTIHGTGQTAEPSCSTSWTINYMDRYGIEAFRKYWDEEVVVGKMKENLEKNGRGMMYMDSLELGTFGRGGQLWGFHYIEEFKARRGYDVTPYLPLVMKKPGMMQPVYEYYYTCEDKIFLEKLLNDLYQTTTDMYCENMMKPMQEWCHSHNMALRSEISYGLPFEISQPGKYVDGIETESLEFASQIDSYRGLAGAAHVYGRTYSSETGATLKNYMMGLDFYTQIIFTQFAAGVTKTVLHGYASVRGSLESTYWPGHEGMWPVFSERFGSRQPAFAHYGDWTKAIARYQMLLRQGKPRMDLAMLRLDYNFNNLVFMGEDEEEAYENRFMRANEGLYWQDMTLQNAGYTWDYFAPQLLEEDFVNFSQGRLLPDGPGYKALILYQNVLPADTARKILAMAKEGLPVVLVNGCTEMTRPGVFVTYKKAAEMTPFNDGRDEELAAIRSELTALPNVWEVDRQADTFETLMKAGIKPTAFYGKPNRNILTHTQEDGDRKYVFVYNMMYTEKDPVSFRLNIEGTGRLYKVDCWNAQIEEAGCFEQKDGYTGTDVTMAPGAGVIYMLDTAEETGLHALQADCKVALEEGTLVAYPEKSGTYTFELCDGTRKEICVEVMPSVLIPKWHLAVEDWNEGERREIIEDRGLGIVTHEYYYETKKTVIDAGETELVPWKDIPSVGKEVSGVGCYTAMVTLPDDWSREDGAYLKIGHANKCTAAVYVNGQKAPAVDIDELTVDVTKLLVPGENEIKVEISSTLNNRLIARGYYEMGEKISMQVAENANNAMEAGDGDVPAPGPEGLFNISYRVRDYGMTGETSLITYKKIIL